MNFHYNVKDLSIGNFIRICRRDELLIRNTFLFYFRAHASEHASFFLKSQRRCLESFVHRILKDQKIMDILNAPKRIVASQRLIWKGISKINQYQKASLEKHYALEGTIKMSIWLYKQMA